MDPTLCALLLGCNADPNDRIAQRVTADRADECDLPGLAWLLRAFAYAELTWLPTGSRVYGTPREDSDFDWVVEATASAVGIYQKYADVITTNRPLFDPAYRPRGNGSIFGLAATLRFGPVNLLVCDARHQWQWDSWCAGTRWLVSTRPATRDEAVRVFQQEFRERM